MSLNKMDAAIKSILHKGVVIPAHPLALNQNLTLDIRRQRLLTQYYIASGAGGVAVGVHTTQFEIRDPSINLLEPVLKTASEEISNHASGPFIKIAGICGPTGQALLEAELATKHGYHLGLVSNGGLNEYTEAQLIKRTALIADIIPVFGFYLQPAVGGRVLSYDFWRDFVEIPGVQAIKIAAFNRYQTLDVVRAVCYSSRRDEIALYSGNDDNIVADLLTPYRFMIHGEKYEKRMVGGLLGHWAVWTKAAVSLLEEIKTCIQHQYNGVEKLLALGVAVTDMNAAIFDAPHAFSGCIPGIHEVLRRQGLIQGTWSLNPKEVLSSGQLAEIDRVYQDYPHLTDDDFVRSFLDERGILIDI
ncbi:MAG: dihydrodipicolinate synthase family protein [Saprospiraceae bacterium]|nr:dihydrodipicolinate synthase family protein [Saprospiraceae bacterium]